MTLNLNSKILGSEEFDRKVFSALTYRIRVSNLIHVTLSPLLPSLLDRAKALVRVIRESQLNHEKTVDLAVEVGNREITSQMN